MIDDLAYLIGVYEGDGSLPYYSYSTVFRLNSIDIEFVTATLESLRRLGYGLESNICKCDSESCKQGFYYAITATIDKQFADRLKDSYSYILINSPRDRRLSYIRGLYDSEGSLCFHEKPNGNLIPEIPISNSDLDLLCFAMTIVESLGYRCSITNSGGKVYNKSGEYLYQMHTLNILGKSLEKKVFLEELQPTIPRKRIMVIRE